MNGALQQRLRFIDIVLEHYGWVQRQVLMDQFGISTPQSSMDIHVYLDVAAGNMEYNKTTRRYERQPKFKRRFA